MRSFRHKLTQAKETPPGGLSARLLRDKVHFKPALDTFTDIAGYAKKGKYLDRSAFTPAQAKALQEEAKRRPGRVGRDERFWAEIADAYVAALAFPNPIKHLHEQMPDLKPSQIRDLIHRARYKAFLTDSTRGKAGGELTDKSKKLLGRKGRKGK